jgi:hypothetical protein
VSELSPKARALLQAQRKAVRPTAADRDRIEAALRTKLGEAALPDGSVAPRAARNLSVKSITGIALGACLMGAIAFRALQPGPTQPEPASHAAPTLSLQPTANSKLESQSQAGSSTANTKPDLQPQAAPSRANTKPDPQPQAAPSTANTTLDSQAAPSTADAKLGLPTKAAPSAANTKPGLRPQASSTANTKRGPQPSASSPASTEPALPLSAAPAPSRPNKPSSRAKPTAPTPDRLALEVQLLSRATSALRSGNFETALQALEEHQQNFPQGALQQERKIAKAQALCSLGRIQEGQAQLQNLPPNTPATARARMSCSY